MGRRLHFCWKEKDGKIEETRSNRFVNDTIDIEMDTISVN